MFKNTLILLVLFLPQAAIAAQSTFTPHKALYDISLKSVSNGSQIANISGKMYYEWHEDCDAWTSKHRFNLLYEYADEPAMRITSDFSTFESFDGKTLDFISRRKQNGELFEEVRGQAANGQALFSAPGGLSYPLPDNTLFPMAHSKFVLQAIKDKQKFASAILFDGSDDEGPVLVNAIIGAPIPNAEKFDAAQDLLNSPAHRVHLAFFPLSSTEQTPDYEIKLTLHENSIISDMDINYGAFSVWQELSALEPMANACGTHK
ncbi:MAG: EipB family protein [Alphaproteobacteria bacterium]